MAIIINRTSQTLLAPKNEAIASNAIKIKKASGIMRQAAGVK